MTKLNKRIFWLIMDKICSMADEKSNNTVHFACTSEASGHNINIFCYGKDFKKTVLVIDERDFSVKKRYSNSLSRFVERSLNEVLDACVDKI